MVYSIDGMAPGSYRSSDSYERAFSTAGAAGVETAWAVAATRAKRRIDRDAGSGAKPKAPDVPLASVLPLRARMG